MKTINKDNIAIIRAELGELLEQYNSNNKHGLTLTIGNASYNDQTVTFKTTATVALEGLPEGMAQTPEAANFLKYAETYGLKTSDLNRVFKSGSREYRIVGLKPNNRANPIIAEDIQSKGLYKFVASDIKRVLGY
ncbi:hypothetical protein [Shewanella marisflavi]|uniref:hypothetical protein n=1 Tax=Shewanella marisflavi TaxID=260364 RepID=UPI003AAA38C9